MEKCLYKRIKCFNNFINFNVFIHAKEGGALLHVYVLEHIGSMCYRIARLIFKKLGRDEELMAPHMC